MKTFLWISVVVGGIALLALAGAGLLGISALALGLMLAAWLAAGLVLNSVENHLPGGAKNPYSADTVGKSNIARKAAVWIGAIFIVTTI